MLKDSTFKTRAQVGVVLSYAGMYMRTSIIKLVTGSATNPAADSAEHYFILT